MYLSLTLLGYAVLPGATQRDSSSLDGDNSSISPVPKSLILEDILTLILYF